MIHVFQNAQVLFPRRWANSVARWIQGLCSPSGTINIKNTLEPSGTGAELDVNIDAIAAKLAERLDKRYIRYSELPHIVDGTSITATAGVLSVSSDFVRGLQ